MHAGVLHLTITRIGNDMQVQLVTSIAELVGVRDRWDQLNGDCVFRSWAWLTTWWDYYSSNGRLHVLLVTDERPGSACCGSRRHSSAKVDPSQLIGVLPCYVEQSLARGRVLRLLGDGEVCSDHLDILAAPHDLERVADAVAEHLTAKASDWDAINFSAVGTDCAGLLRLWESLGGNGCSITQRSNASRWSVPLPADWEAFLTMQSKSHRKQIRRLLRSVEADGQAIWYPVNDETAFEIAWPILVDLHQRRRNSLGEPGCFASDRWANFHRDIARQLLARGELRLSWLELEGQPAAVEYQFAGSTATYAYQGGVDPNRINEQPGNLSLIYTIQRAINDGHQQYDFLRGDEPYKAHWRATPIPTADLHAIAPHSAARLRNHTINYMQSAARQVASLLG